MKIENQSFCGRKEEEVENLTLLGNRGTKYPDNYAPEVLETFINNLTVQNLQVFVQLLDNLTLQILLFLMYQQKKW